MSKQNAIKHLKKALVELGDPTPMPLDDASQRLADIANVIRARLNGEGLVVIDENLGDVAETYESILHHCTDGKEGQSWGILG